MKTILDYEIGDTWREGPYEVKRTPEGDAYHYVGEEGPDLKPENLEEKEFLTQAKNTIDEYEDSCDHEGKNPSKDVLVHNSRHVPDDKVNHPSHYTKGSIEVIDGLEAITSRFPAQVRYHVGNVIKYICRAPFKNGKEDLKKAQWYTKRAISLLIQEQSMWDIVYILDIMQFIKDASSDGYNETQKAYVASILTNLAYGNTPSPVDAGVFVIGDIAGPKHGARELLEQVERDLEKLINSYPE